MKTKPGPGQVAVRWAIPETLRARKGSLLDQLSSEERHAAARLQVPEDAVAYTTAHALLRSTLSEHAPHEPSEWQFVIGRHGKPELAASFHAGLCFSLSHTRGCVGCAVTGGADVGIDVESRERSVDVLEIARRTFTAAEYARLAACAPALRDERFLRSWTLKEAILKALGTGLSEAMEGFEFSFSPEGPDKGRVRLAVAPTGVRVGAGWHFEQRVVAGRYIVAVAVRPPEQGTAGVDFREVNGL